MGGLPWYVIRTLKAQCTHRHRFEPQQHAMRVIALRMKIPAEAYALAA